MDLKRLKSYTNNIVDLYMIRDLIPSVAKLYFLKSLNDDCRLSRGQACLLLGLGLQFKEIEETAREMDVPINQGLALFNKCIKRICNQLNRIYEMKHRKEIEKTFGQSVSLIENRIDLLYRLERAFNLLKVILGQNCRKREEEF